MATFEFGQVFEGTHAEIREFILNLHEAGGKAEMISHDKVRVIEVWLDLAPEPKSELQPDFEPEPKPVKEVKPPAKKSPFENVEGG